MRNVNATEHGEQIHIRAVNGDGQRCGCGKPSRLRSHIGSLSEGVTERDVFLCQWCALIALENYVQATGQPRFGETALP